MAGLPPLGQSGIKRTFLRQAAQAALLVGFGVGGGLLFANRDGRLRATEAGVAKQDSATPALDRRVGTLEGTMHTINRRLCHIERATGAQLDETCPPRVQ